MEAKKISFSFSKISKKLNLLPIKDHVKADTKVELIKCLEGQEIKLVVEKIEEPPLTIPLKEAHKTSAALASLLKRRAVLLGEEEPEENNKKQTEPSLSSSNDEHEDLEKRAARELLAETELNNSTDPSSKLVLPVVKPEDLPLDGAKESTLDEYESIPIQDFGKAMLRGMGWSEPPPKSNKKSGAALDDTPMVRPKGMGLGADKALNKKPLLVVPEANEVLEVKRNAYVCILSGKHKNLYGQIEGFDDYAGRVIVKMAIGGAKEAFNEFLCQPVSKKEYAQYGKCINNSKYDEYKKMENEHGQIVLNEDKPIDKDSKDHQKIKKEHINSTESQKSNRNDEDFKKIKRENDIYRSERSDRRDYNKYERKDRSRDDEYDRKILSKKNEDEERRIEFNRYADRDHNRESKREEDKNRKTKAEHSDKRHHRREYDDDKDYCRDDGKDTKRDERDRYEHKSDNRNSSSYRKSEDSYSRNCGKSPNRNIQRERDRKDTVETKTVELDDSSDSENDSYAPKHKKSKKSKHSKKKLKKSKKSKSKYKNNSSDTETSSNDTSCVSEEEKYKKHKKKTKKSKRQRERSPSRGRR